MGTQARLQNGVPVNDSSLNETAIALIQGAYPGYIQTKSPNLAAFINGKGSAYISSTSPDANCSSLKRDKETVKAGNDELADLLKKLEIRVASDEVDFAKGRLN